MKLLPYDQGKADYWNGKPSDWRTYARDADQEDYDLGYDTAKHQDGVGSHSWDRLQVEG